MPRFAANLTTMFNEVPFLDRFEAAARAGFDAVEFLFPYAYPAREIRSRLAGNGLQLVLHNLPGGDWDAGERGIACHPDRVIEFHTGIARAIEYAHTLEVQQLNCLVGKIPPAADRATLRRTLVANLRFAAGELKKAGVKLLVEPINPYDIPGFFVTRTDEALQLLDDVESDNIFLQYDIYHAQRMEGEIAATIERHLPRIAHLQLADNPGRHEPGTGEIAYDFLLRHIDRLGYAGWIGCEYKPAASTEAGLGWLGRYLVEERAAA
jgi:hydroxypyruvate isomerase